MSRIVRLGLALLVCLSAAADGAPVSAAQPIGEEAVARLSAAVGIQGATRARLETNRTLVEAIAAWRDHA